MKLFHIILALLGCFFWGTSPLFARLITLPAGNIIFIRCILSSLFLIVIICFLKSPFKLKSTKDFLIITFLSFCMCLHLIFIYLAYKITNVSVVLIAFFTYPLFTTIFEKIFAKRHFKPIEFLAIFFILIGVTIISFNKLSSTNMLIGIFYGICSSIFFSARNVSFRLLKGNYNSFWLMLLQYGLGIIILTPLYADLTISISTSNWIYLVLVSIVVGILGHTAIMESMKSLSASTVSILSSSQIIVAPTLAFFILGEPINLYIIFGGIFVMIAFFIQLFTGFNH